MKKNNLKFTGERMIPKINRGAAFYYEHLTRYFFASQFCKNKTVLDIACGTGYGSRILKKRGKAKKIIGVDISSETINYANKKYKTSGVSFLNDDATKQTLISQLKFDVIVSFETIEHLSKQKKFIELLYPKLNNKGILIVSTPNTLTYPKGNPYHVNELDPKEFTFFLKNYFSHVQILSQKFYITQLINKRISGRKKRYVKTKETSYVIPSKIEDSEYLIAICSNSKLPKIKSVSMATSKVDNFDLKNGMITLSKQFSDITEKVNLLNMELSQIKDSKFFRLWQKFNKIKKLFKFHA